MTDWIFLIYKKKLKTVRTWCLVTDPMLVLTAGIGSPGQVFNIIMIFLFNNSLFFLYLSCYSTTILLLFGSNFAADTQENIGLNTKYTRDFPHFAQELSICGHNCCILLPLLLPLLPSPPHVLRQSCSHTCFHLSPPSAVPWALHTCTSFCRHLRTTFARSPAHDADDARAGYFSLFILPVTRWRVLSLSICMNSILILPQWKSPQLNPSAVWVRVCGFAFLVTLTLIN